MKIITLSHVSQYIQLIEEMQSKFIRNQHNFYRGESRLTYELLPSIFRRDDFGSETYLSQKSEFKILTEFMTDAACYIDLSPDDMFRWLQYAQHFRVPTRLLDWTANPLVALYFACSSNYKDDGRVYILNSFRYRLLTNEKNNMDGKIILEEAMKMIRDSEKTYQYPALFKPYYHDHRMAAQSSRFMVWGYRKEPLNVLVNELEQDGKKTDYEKQEVECGQVTRVLEEIDVLTDIQIRGTDKLNLLWELDKIGVNKATLFPGLDGIGSAIEWRNNKNNKE